jgi:hypothetical protein
MYFSNRRPPSRHPQADQREIERRALAQAASSTLSSREVDSEEAAGMDTERLLALRRLLFKFFDVNKKASLKPPSNSSLPNSLCPSQSYADYTSSFMSK